MAIKTILALFAACLLAGCTTTSRTSMAPEGQAAPTTFGAAAPEDIAPVQMSTASYEAMSCQQLRPMAESLSRRGIAAVNSGDAGQIAQIKGEIIAFQAINAQKNCGILIQ